MHVCLRCDAVTRMLDSKKVAQRPDPSLRKQKRGLLTRQQLLRSARFIFARDGFQNARLEDIASRAGKTRGAFYDNFKDKEDVFYAIFEENIDRDLRELGPLLQSLPTVDRRVAALSAFLDDLSQDRERTLLNLEFKLYAIRHPRRRKRLAALHGSMLLQSSIPELDRLLPDVAPKDRGTRLRECFALAGILDGLALNRMFDPNLGHWTGMPQYLHLCLKYMVEGSSSRNGAKKKTRG